MQDMRVRVRVASHIERWIAQPLLSFECSSLNLSATGARPAGAIEAIHAILAIALRVSSQIMTI